MTLLTEEEISQKLQNLSGWSYKDNALNKNFTFSDFRTTMANMMRISFEAEEMNHHPNWSNVYNQLDISLSTHDAGGVTEKDIELASRIESLVV